MKPASARSLLLLGLPAAVALLALAAPPRRPPVATSGPRPYLSGGGGCVSGTRLCPDGTCQVPGVRSCGTSCTDCALVNPANSTPVCTSGGSCSFTCQGGYHQCGSACPSNASPATCGTSCTACPGPSQGQGSSTCDGTSCGVTCASGYWQSAATACTSQSFTAAH